MVIVYLSREFVDIFSKGCVNRDVGVERWKFDGGMETGEGEGGLALSLYFWRGCNIYSLVVSMKPA